MPRIITARQLGLSFQNLFGDLGPELNVTGHHSAVRQPTTLSQTILQVRAFHLDHKSKGWGGLGYHFVIAPDGTLICGRPTRLKGAHVGLHNTENLGVLFPGTLGDHPTPAQAKTYRWLLRYAHTRRLPRAHRTDRKLTEARRRGHHDWPGHQANACPGDHETLIVTTVRSEADRKARP